MSDQDRWTIGRLLQWTTDYLRKSGSSSPRLDAELLLAHARQCERIQLYTAFEEDPSEAIRTQFRELVKRRAAGEPVAYLVGHREFFSLNFLVNQQVLIPRPETEFVVLGVLDAIRELAHDSEPLHIADVGTGSGAIAISVARHAPAAKLTAIDVSPGALELARQNAERLGVADRIEFMASDLFDQLAAEVRFDVIASNPPYVSEAEFATLSRDVREFEPRAALVGGPQGTEVIQRLTDQASEHLRPGGWLLMEISPMIDNQVREILNGSGHWRDLSITKDLAGLVRTIRACKATP